MAEMPSADWTWINAEADRFERSWKRGPRPRIEDFLAGVDEPRRPALLDELLRIERERRQREGEHPRAEEYRGRFPEHAAVVDAVFEPGTGSSTEGHAGDGDTEPGTPLIRQLGDYELIRELGRGGMGIVYEARQVSLDRPVALKVLPSEVTGDPRRLRRFEREARAAGRLHHTNIVPVFGLGHHEGTHFYIMQLIRGPGLDAVIGELLRLQQSGTGRQDADQGHHAAADPAVPTAAELARSLATGRLAKILPRPRAAELACLASDSSDRVELGRWGRDEAAGEASMTVPNPGPSDVGGSALRAPATRGSEGTSPGPMRSGPGEGGLAAPTRGPTSVQPDGPAQATPAAVAPDPSTLSGFSGSGSSFFDSVARIGRQVAEGLDHAHGQGILHRDIKPSNLLLDLQGNAWITDFGLAKASDSDDLSGSRDVIGTLRYMAPERLEGRADARSDIYALGLTLYELLALRPAFDATNANRLFAQVTNEDPPPLRRLDPTIPRDLATIVHRAIAREATWRYATAAALAEELGRFLDRQPIRARRTPPHERFLLWCRRNPALAAMNIAAAVLTTVLAVVSTLAAWTYRDQRNAPARRREQDQDGVEREDRRRARVAGQALRRPGLRRPGPAVQPPPRTEVRESRGVASGHADRPIPGPARRAARPPARRGDRRDGPARSAADRPARRRPAAHVQLRLRPREDPLRSSVSQRRDRGAPRG